MSPTTFIDNSRRKKKCERNVGLEVFDEYCHSSSIHGIRYLETKYTTAVEKIWWIIIIVLSMTACAFLISKAWKKWNDSPVIVSFAQEQTAVWQISFPAVTVCPMNKVRSLDYNYMEMFKKRDELSGDEYKKFWDISLICNLEAYDIDTSNLSKITDEEAIDNIRSVAPEVSMFEEIFWKNRVFQIKEGVFAEQITEDGICFTFNSLSQSDMFTDELNHNIIYINHSRETEGWSMERGYFKHERIYTYPRRTPQDGLKAGLTFSLITVISETDFVCGLPISGFKVILHNPIETPRSGHQYILIPINKHTTLTVNPTVIESSKDLRYIPAHTRKCYFPYEKSLRFFKVYTQNNCKTECLTNVTLQHCECVPFFMPRDNTTAVCGLGSTECMKEAQKKINDYQILEHTMTSEERKSVEYNTFKKCDCLPSCYSLEFLAETSQAEGHLIKSIFATGFLSEAITSANLTEDFIEESLTVTEINIFFKESFFLALNRNELYGLTEFLANCGGFLGLFMGFSVLSLLEIIYFLTMRIWFRVKDRKIRTEKIGYIP